MAWSSPELKGIGMKGKGWRGRGTGSWRRLSQVKQSGPVLKQERNQGEHSNEAT